MRTAQEIRDYIAAEIEKCQIRNPGFSSTSSVWGNLNNLLEFIDSDPPCQHPKVFWRPELPAGLTSFPPGWWLYGRGETFLGMVKYCPDCGQKLEDPCEVSKK